MFFMHPTGILWSWWTLILLSLASCLGISSSAAATTTSAASLTSASTLSTSGNGGHFCGMGVRRWLRRRDDGRDDRSDGGSS